MSTKEEWEAAYRDLIADGRGRLGPPPTFEEVEALSRGDLSESEADRVRELLVYYPEMARVMSEPFPTDAEGVLTEAEVAADLAKIRERIRRVPAPPVSFPDRRFSPRMLAVAAAVVIVVGVGSLVVRQMIRPPRAVATKILYADDERGGSYNSRGPSSSAVALLSTGTDYVLKPAFSSRRRYREYRLELLGLGSTPPRRVWLRDDVERQSDATYPVTVSTEDLEPGLYRLVLYGVGKDVEPLAEYTLRVAGP